MNPLIESRAGGRQGDRVIRSKQPDIPAYVMFRWQRHKTGWPINRIIARSALARNEVPQADGEFLAPLMDGRPTWHGCAFLELSHGRLRILPEMRVMEVRNVRHSYRRRTVLRGVDLHLRGGVVAGIVGENGAGKTTLLRVLAGELRPTHGTVRHSGRFGYCPQHAVLNDALTVRQHLDFFQSAFRLPQLGHAEWIMNVLGLAEYADERAGVLSGGTRQKLNLTLALMHDPQVLLLDEPYQGFDWETPGTR